MQLYAFLTAVLDGGSGELHVLAALFPKKESAISISKRLGETQSKPECGGVY